MVRRTIATVTWAVCLLLLLGCSQKEPSAPQKVPKPKLVIGLIPEQNIFKQLERYAPLAEHLTKKTGTKIELKILPRYGNIIDNFRSSGLDGAFFGSFTYTLAHAKLGVEVLARPVGMDNSSTYHGLIFVRKDSGIRNARGMKGKRFAFVDKATTAGYLLPLAYFHGNGIPDYKNYLKEAYFAGTHEDVICDVLNRKTDIGAAKNTVYQRLANADPRIPRELVVLERSPDVPENGLALRGDIDGGTRNRLKKTILDMHQDQEGRKVLEQFGALRFIETTNADYRPVLMYVESIHLDLNTYDYLND